jgi:hypothetical protein
LWFLVVVVACLFFFLLLVINIIIPMFKANSISFTYYQEIMNSSIILLVTRMNKIVKRQLLLNKKVKKCLEKQNERKKYVPWILKGCHTKRNLSFVTNFWVLHYYQIYCIKFCWYWYLRTMSYQKFSWAIIARSLVFTIENPSPCLIELLALWKLRHTFYKV